MTTLKHFRKFRRLSASTVAEHMGVTDRTIYLWEGGERAISARDLEKLMAFYQVDLPISQISSILSNKKISE